MDRTSPCCGTRDERVGRLRTRSGNVRLAEPSAVPVSSPSSSTPRTTELTPATRPAATLTSAARSTEEPASSPLFGSWTTTLTRAQMAAALKKADLGQWTDKFFQVEEIGPTISWTFTFSDGRFSGAYKQPDGTWKVGWRGELVLTGDKIAMYDLDLLVTDTFRWKVDGDRLALTPLGTDSTGPLKDIPAMVYDVAYMTPEPFVRAPS